MSERKWDPNKIRLSIAKDLRAIELLYQGVWAEVLANADNPEIPGGDAMVMRGPTSDPEAWSYRELSDAMGRTDGHHGEYEDDGDPQPPLLVLATWSDAIRKERGQDTILAASIDRECTYIAKSVDWMLSADENGDMNFLAIDDLATALRQVNRRLQNLLHVGKQVDRGAPCLAHGRRYIKVWDEPGDPPTVYGYRWRCWGDKDADRDAEDYVDTSHWADPDDYARANKDQVRGLADRLTSSDMELEYRIKPSTLRTLAERGCVPKRGKDKSGRVLYDVATAVQCRDGEHEHRGCGSDTPRHALLSELFGA